MFRNQAIVLMYHRVAEPVNDPWQIMVSPEHFSQQLDVLKRKASVIPLDRLVSDYRRNALKRKSVVLTFDDGYLDNFTTVRPLLEKFDLPATFFITTGKIGTREEFWWDELARLMLQSDELPAQFSLPVGTETIGVETGAEARLTPELKRQNETWTTQEDPPNRRCALFLAIWEKMRATATEAQRSTLGSLRELARFNGPAVSEGPCMSEEQLASLGRHELVRIGAHTVTHPALGEWPEAFQREEILNCRTRLEEITGQTVNHLAYPFGVYNETSTKVAGALGFEAAVTTREKVVDGKSSPLELGRFEVVNWGGEEFEEYLHYWINK